ncbi:TIGR03089 family protein [Streptomyces sp. AJS327]|uniref:TIGR03089 family protein n=1 Tax=Streptomyces sp. AJS327 TaxID=2545265 RepID=UPI0015DF38ED|nr:TIGR03089 family protein [Streptomyces sp. AJS327]MBA0049468.1 TIGR03089 family protein [Streptomyces sp. AJS327]
MNAIDSTPASLLRSALARDPARPLVTYYDDTSGERVELSVATFANWVAKTANLLQDDLSAEPGDRLALLLPAHWQTAVWLLACSETGVRVAPGGAPSAADLVVSGPETLEEARACRGERVALSLRPMGARFPDPPSGFLDFAVEVPGQGDQFTPYSPVGGGEPWLTLPGTTGAELTGAEVVERARADAAERGLGPGSRLLSVLPFDDWEGLSAGLFAPLAADASVVLCHGTYAPGERAGLSPERAARLTERLESERVTHTAD